MQNGPARRSRVSMWKRLILPNYPILPLGGRKGGWGGGGGPGGGGGGVLSPFDGGGVRPEKNIGG